MVFGTALVVPAFVTTLLVTDRYVASERARLTALAQKTNGHIVDQIDHDLSGQVSMLQALATSPALTNGDLAHFHEQAVELGSLQGTTIVLQDLNERDLVNTATPWGQALPQSSTALANRIVAAMRQPHTSDLIIGPVRSQSKVSVTVPVVREGALTYLLHADVRVQHFADILSHERLAAPYFASIVDRQGRIIARSAAGKEFVGKSLPGFDVATGPRGTWSGSNPQGIRVFGLYQRSSLSGWLVSMGVDEAALEAPLRRSQLLMLGFAAALLVCGAVQALVVSRVMTGALRKLGATAALAKQIPVAAPRTPITEVNRIGEVLAEASATLHEQSGALACAKNELERRVEERTRELADKTAMLETTLDQITHLARRDPLTGLANRAFLLEQLDQALARLRRHGESFSLFFLDLDQFKVVNDAFGHAVGDDLLIAVAKRLKAATRETDLVARLGGDEFAIVQAHVADQKEDAIILANRLLDTVTTPYDIDNHRLSIETSIGIALAEADCADPAELLKTADIALYKAKAGGRNAYRFFEPAMHIELRNRHARESDLRNAICRGEFDVYYQPVINTATGAVHGFEALARWHHPHMGVIKPEDFIPLAEETGVVVPLGEMILRKACADAAAWRGNVNVAVNVSPVQIRKGHLVDCVTSALVDSGLTPQRLEIEITESVLIQKDERSLAVLHELRSLGIAIVLDDFGTGYSSLGYLQMFPFDRIKIDKSFVSDLSKRADSAAIVCAITGLARNLNIAVTAEGVETQDQMELLRAAGCTEMQGFLFSRPRPLAELDWGDFRVQGTDERVA